GFGLSEGLHCYIPSFDSLVDDVIEIYSKIKENPEIHSLPSFLFGQSMGGAVALKMHLKQPKAWDGAILVAPMCKIADDMVPPMLLKQILIGIANILPKQKLVPQKNLAEAAFRDLKKREMNKCAFGQEKVEFMDHVISKAGVTVDPANVESKPLTELTKKEGFKWNEAAAEAFQKLKVAVTTAPVLVLPNFKLPFEIECDASGRGVGAVLMQMRHPIAYFSKALASSKLYKSAYDKELMALVLAIQHWPHYLLGRRFTAENHYCKSAKMDG
ncbi:monoglyceride lipase, partial [Trifolium pratense]